jgi:3-deoxy-D-manno-octulosonic-acid transferase
MYRRLPRTPEFVLSPMRWLYTAIFYLAVPLILLRLLWRSRRAPAYRARIGERFGFFRMRPARDSIWVHAVSVGETIAAAPLIRRLQARYPHFTLIVTTMTPTGSERVRALFGAGVEHVYAPYDLPDCVGRFLRRTRPRLAVIMETELWPNLLRGCARRGIPVLLANARLSARSARGYRRLRALTAPMLGDLAMVVAQNADDGARFVGLGLLPARLVVAGSIKFDIALDEQLVIDAARARAEWGELRRPLWIAASTHAGEDEIALAAHRQLLAAQPAALLILVPRHPERFDAVAALIERAGCTYRRRSQGAAPAQDTQVLLGDTMGELLWLYGCADIAFVGGSLIARGGHNTLEPAAWGLPLLSGPSDFNFHEISALLARAGALVKVRDAQELAAQLIALAASAPERSRRGAAARAGVAGNRGARDKQLGEIERLLD